MEYLKRIEKSEIKHFPIVEFTGPIIVVDSEDQVSSAIKELKAQRILGIDTESKPSFKKGESYSVSLLQFSTEDKAYLFRLNKIGFPEGLLEILEDKNIFKIGLALLDDIRGLKKLADFHPQSLIDLGEVAANLKIITQGLQSLTGIFLKQRLSKKYKLTNWQAPDLGPRQLVYAATDAWICLILFDHLIENNLVKLEETKLR
ncbi:MAG: 3'-5' exonuclease domain-containing protein 2 [Bacteriovoracaceae bacterium]|jgi:ribonuclease D|nr:3'-5' exonuclease domain-containing protein 2 [Bacteriovoracaceae bacterium]